MPRAWTTGEALPWPSQQQVREQRQRAQRGARGEATDEPAGDAAGAKPATRNSPAAPRPQPRTGEAHSASKKKRRKRRS
jgi:hypothetical protein